MSFNKINIDKITEKQLMKQFRVVDIKGRSVLTFLDLLCHVYLFVFLVTSIMHFYPSIRYNDHDLVYHTFHILHIFANIKYTSFRKQPMFWIYQLLSFFSMIIKSMLIYRYFIISMNCQTYKTCQEDPVVFSCYGALIGLLLIITFVMSMVSCKLEGDGVYFNRIIFGEQPTKSHEKIRKIKYKLANYLLTGEISNMIEKIVVNHPIIDEISIHDINKNN